MKLTKDYYDEGYRNGHLDKLLGLRLMVCLTSTLPGYASGYHDGQMNTHKTWGESEHYETILKDQPWKSSPDVSPLTTYDS
jgi:hypothetical protein